MTTETRKDGFVVYGSFGCKYRKFIIPKNETHHKTFEKAFEYRRQLEVDGKKAWIRRIH